MSQTVVLSLSQCTLWPRQFRDFVALLTTIAVIKENSNVLLDLEEFLLYEGLTGFFFSFPEGKQNLGLSYLFFPPQNMSSTLYH